MKTLIIKSIKIELVVIANISKKPKKIENFILISNRKSINFINFLDLSKLYKKLFYENMIRVICF